MRVVDSEQMAAIDAATIAGGLPGAELMERAARAVADAVIREAGLCAVAVLVGPGNNGGDGSAAARMLAHAGCDVVVVRAATPDRLTGDARANFERLAETAVQVVAAGSDEAAAALARSSVQVDALLGIGQREAVRGAVGDALRQAAAVRPACRVAVDVPTGVAACTGAVLGDALPADVTVTFGHLKWGLVLPPARALCGDVRVADIGFHALDNGGATTFGHADALAAWAPVPAGAHKGTQGHVLVVAGSDAMPGAAALSAEAALRAGAGLVTLCAPASVRALVRARAPEVMGMSRGDLGARIDRFDSCVLGPGLGRGAAAARVVAEVLAAPDTLPVVVDADALTLLARGASRRHRPGLVLTPHPGELATLLGRETREVVADLPRAARAAAERYGATVVAKTAGAVIVGPRDAMRFVQPGSPGMATAGSGDVLAGVIGALRARHDAAQAAPLGAWIHAAAGREAADALCAASLRASDIIAALPAAFRALEP